MTTHCACIVVDRLDGPEGTLYARDHLTRIMADAAARAALYRCPDTGALWRLAYRAGEDAADPAIELERIDAETARREFDRARDGEAPGQRDPR